MLERLSDLPTGIDGVSAVGTITKQDYEQVLRPLFDEARRGGRRVRLLYELGPRYTGFSAGAAWEDAKLGMSSLRLFEACAVVTDTAWIRDSVRLAAFFLPCPVAVFGTRERAAAIEWLRALPERPAIEHHLLAGPGVLVVEVARPLRREDFEALAATADSWIEAHGALAGVVIHARAFPGWENLAGMVRHIRFVRDHHRHVKRIALAIDGELPELAARVAEHFVAAEVRIFHHAELERATAWAGTSG
ncbi:MAG TPA: STAS/SEC14 domain-containing protein [Kofleriaceae bacterium]|nr:STAS/SEC14 domain-containing protein [Kofleriaceae bacterium]